MSAVAQKIACRGTQRGQRIQLPVTGGGMRGIAAFSAAAVLEIRRVADNAVKAARSCDAFRETPVRLGKLQQPVQLVFVRGQAAEHDGIGLLVHAEDTARGNRLVQKQKGDTAASRPKVADSLPRGLRGGKI